MTPLPLSTVINMVEYVKTLFLTCNYFLMFIYTVHVKDRCLLGKRILIASLGNWHISSSTGGRISTNK